MVTDPERWSRELVAWCNLESNPACLEFYNSRRRVARLASRQVRQPIYGSSVARWKNYERPLGELLRGYDLLMNVPAT